MSGKAQRNKRSEPESDKTARPEPTGCHYWAAKKKRYCPHQLPRGSTEKYCSQHVYLAPETNEKASVQLNEEGIPKRKSGKRIPCPLDPNHTIFESELERHLKRCNKMRDLKEMESLPFFTRDINLLGDNLKERTGESIPRLYYDHVREIKESEYQLNASLVEHVGQYFQAKHTIQYNSIIENMADVGLVSTDFLFLELGAGKGGLSNIMRHKIGPESNHILLDNAAFKAKRDKDALDAHLKNQDSMPEGWKEGIYRRFKIDIKDFDLQAIPEDIHGRVAPAVGIGKHLCGGCTDFSLRSMVTGVMPAAKIPVKGLVFATCCHHRCTWDTYANTRWMASSLGIGEEEFALLARLSSWTSATTEKGQGETRDSGKDTEEHDYSEDPKMEKNEKWGAIQQEGSQMSIRERNELGRFCKRLLDEGRCRYLEQNGFAVELRSYVDRETSLEDVIIVARRRGIKTAF